MSRHRNKIICGVIFIVALLVRLYMIQLDPFLHDWDERFHALVARNMLTNPFKPMLNQSHILWYNYVSWTWNETWLHKQPLFMWQMALSMKIFGVSEISMRIPSAVLGALSCVFLYRIAQITTDNKRVALIVAALWCFSHYQLELVSGYLGMDHNDVSFSCYVLMSIWAFLEHQKNKRTKWVIIIGVAVGFAVLSKWLTGILIFAPWGILALVEVIKERKFTELKYLSLAVLVSCIVFVPWQIYILLEFPKEALFEYEYNQKHIYQVVEGHSGTWKFYLQQFPRYFGKYLYYLVPLGVLFCFRKFNKFHFANGIMVSLVFGFFSFVVESKLPSFFFIVVPLILIYIVIAVEDILSKFKAPSWIFILITIPMLWLSLNPKGIKQNHDRNNGNIQRKIANTKIYKKLRSTITDTTHLVNANTLDNIELMFYNPKVLSSEWFISKDSLQYFLEKGCHITTTLESIDSLEEFKRFPNFDVIPYKLELAGP